MQKMLAMLKEGECGEIIGFSGDFPDKKRMYALGILPGARITCLYQSPLKDPTAYRVFDTMLALRKADCVHIFVKTNHEN